MIYDCRVFFHRHGKRSEITRVPGYQLLEFLVTNLKQPHIRKIEVKKV